MKKKIMILTLCFMVSLIATANKPVASGLQELDVKAFKEKVWNIDKNKTFVREGRLPIILDFSATWCQPCKRILPHLLALQEKYKGKLLIYEIDVDKTPELAQRFKVEGMPTLIFIPNTNSFKSLLGYKEYNELDAAVNSLFFKK